MGNALSPARVLRVNVIDAQARVAQVIVPDYQLSLAIGKEGQNARLAARLTGWKIDIQPDTPRDPGGAGRPAPAAREQAAPEPVTQEPAAPEPAVAESADSPEPAVPESAASPEPGAAEPARTAPGPADGDPDGPVRGVPEGAAWRGNQCGAGRSGNRARWRRRAGEVS